MAKIVYMQLENDSETDKNEDSGTRVITHNKEIKNYYQCAQSLAL